MRILPEHFWTSPRYRWIRSIILATLIMVPAVSLIGVVSENVWINAGSGFVVYLLVVYLRWKRML